MKKHPYGICKCGIGFKIPGLERSLCSLCGWVTTPSMEKPKAINPPKPKRERKIKLKPTSDEQLGLFSGGGDH